MPKSKILIEAKASLASMRASHANASSRSHHSLGLDCIRNSINTLNKDEQLVLFGQCQKALKRERRRANAKASTYDLSRHITLYLTVKALTAQQTNI